MNNYSIFDGNKPLLEGNKEIQAPGPKKAIEAYLRSIGEVFNKVTVDGGSFARLSAQPFYFRDGTKYRDSSKRTMWFSVQ